MPGNPIFSALYDRLLASSEKAGLADMRADLLREASGAIAVSTPAARSSSRLFIAGRSPTRS